MFAAKIWSYGFVFLDYAKRLEMETVKTCIYCGAPIIGRADKLFCSASCKNAWHNRMTASERRCRERTLSILWNNYKILESLMESGESNILIETVPGFKPDYVTGYRKLRTGRVDLSCFDITYNKTEARLYNIRRAPDQIL